MRNGRERAMDLLADLSEAAVRLSMLEKVPRDFGTGGLLYPAEIHTIAFVGDRPGAGPTDVARSLGVTRGAVSQMIGKLERKGLLERRDAEENAVAVRLFLTPEGRKAHEAHAAMHARIAERLAGYIGPVTPVEHTRVKRILKDIAREIEAALRTRGIP